MFKPSIDNSNVKQLVSHMLSKMNFDKYQQFLEYVDRNPEQDHKFVVFEYVESPSYVLISRSERLPGTQTSIHSLIQNPEFDENMRLLFGKSDILSWYTRRKMDYSKPENDRLTDIRQLVVMIKRDPEDYSDMPPLIPADDSSIRILNPEDYYADMPSMIPISSYNHIGGLNQTMWTPSSYNYNYTCNSPTPASLS